MKQVNWKKLILPNIPYVFIALFATKLGEAIRLAPGSDLSGKIMHFMEGLVAAFATITPSFHPVDLCVGIAVAAAIRLAVYVKGKNAKKFRKNLEYGSARWGTSEDIKPYIDPVFENNIILTQTESLTMNNRPADPKTARNKNVLIIGGSGSGKTRFWLKPNLLQCTSEKYPTSFVVTDPKGSIVTECGNVLLRNHYRLKILNTINFKKSMHYNPFAYIHSEKDILKLVTVLITNTKGDGKMQQHIINFKKTHDVYKAYQKAGYSKKFLLEHESDIIKHKAAKKFFDDRGMAKWPKIKKLRADFDELVAKKRTLNAERKKVEKEVRELQMAQYFVDRAYGDAEKTEKERKTVLR